MSSNLSVAVIIVPPPVATLRTVGDPPKPVVMRFVDIIANLLTHPVFRQPGLALEAASAARGLFDNAEPGSRWIIDIRVHEAFVIAANGVTVQPPDAHAFLAQTSAIYDASIAPVIGETIPDELKDVLGTSAEPEEDDEESLGDVEGYPSTSINPLSAAAAALVEQPVKAAAAQAKPPLSGSLASRATR